MKRPIGASVECSGTMKVITARQVVLAVMLLVVAFAGPAGAQLGPAPAQPPSVWRLTDFDLDGPFSPAIDPIGVRSQSGTLAAPGGRLGFGVFDLGVSVAPRRPGTTLTRATETTSALYRLADTEVSTTDVGVDLRLRWPSHAGTAEAGGPMLQPYLSLGPALTVPIGDDALALNRTTPRHEPGMGLGVRGALGLTWQVAPGAALFGEYRLMQDRPLGGKAGGEVGVDLFYGFSLKF